MANNYGGAGLRPSEDAGAKGADSQQAAATASTLSGYVEALFAEQYAREQAADHPNPCEGFAFKYGVGADAD